MKHYPYFVMDLVLMAVLLVIVPAGALLMEPPSFATAAVSIIVFALFFRETLEKILDFRSSAKDIPGLESWESDFMSIGTLIFVFKGQMMRYSSALRGRVEGLISMDYTIRTENGSKASFEAVNMGKGWLGEFSVSGDLKMLGPLSEDIDSFNRRYMLSRISNKDGVLESVANLRFKSGKPPSKEQKLDEMQAFLTEFIRLNYEMNEALKSVMVPAEKAARKKSTGKRTKRKK